MRRLLAVILVCAGMFCISQSDAQFNGCPPGFCNGSPSSSGGPGFSSPHAAGGGCSMAFDAVSSGAGAPVSGNVSWTHTPVGTPTAVAVLIQDYNIAQTAVSYGGTSMGSAVTTKTDSNGAITSIYGLANPPSGPQAVLITVANGTYVGGAAVTVTCSNTTTVFDDAESNTGTATSSNQTVNSTAAEIVVDIAASYNSTGHPFVVTGTGHTVRVSALDAGNNELYVGTMPGGAGTTTPGWTYNASSIFSDAAASFKHQ
jgi:hypothetical protein